MSIKTDLPDFEIDFGILDGMEIPSLVNDETPENLNPENIKEKEEEETKEEEKTEEKEDSPVKLMAEWLKEKQLMDYKEEEFEDSEDFLKSKYEEKLKQEAQSYIHPKVKEFSDLLEKGVDYNELFQSKQREIEYKTIRVDDIDSDPKLAESLYERYLESQDLEEEDIKKKIEKAKDSLSMEDEARIALKQLKKIEINYQIQLKEQAEERQTNHDNFIKGRLEEIKKEVTSSKEFIEGVPVKDSNKFFKDITEKDRSGMTKFEKVMSDPKNFYKAAQFILQLDGKMDIAERKALTKVTKKLNETSETGGQEDNKSFNLSNIQKSLSKLKKQY